MQSLNEVVLTQDQQELVDNLNDFLKDNRCYFGVYGPAGSGKSFTISYFINKNALYDKVILSGTTNNACRVLEQSLETHNTITVYEFIKKINIFISDLKININLLEGKNIKDKDEGHKSRINDDIINYFNKLKEFLVYLRNKSFEYIKNETNNKNETDNKNEQYDILEDSKKRINEIKNEIKTFINENCIDIIQDKLYIKNINIIIENIFNKNRYIKTIHSLLSFEQSRDENHNIVFLPSKSNIKETKTKNGIKYEFTPKLTGKNKICYDNFNQDEKNTFDKDYYEKIFSNLFDSELLIIDESSMMKEIEFRYVIYICKILKLKVIFLGDKYQLPPVEDEEQLTLDEENEYKINYSPAVKLKSSYTLYTIKRTSNPVLQEIYKTFRDLVERAGQGKVKLENIQFTKNINPTDKYLIKINSDIKNVIDYIKTSDLKLENTRILCFSNKEVNRMNETMRYYLYGDIQKKYVVGETLLVINYMTAPRLSTQQLILIENSLENTNKYYFNYIYNKITEGSSYISKETLQKNNINSNLINKNNSFENSEEIKNIIETFKGINNKENTIKLYTSSSIKIIKIFDTQVYIKDKLLNISVIFFNYENIISLFFDFNKKEREYVNNILKTEKQLIKLNTDLFRLHKCNERCENFHENNNVKNISTKVDKTKHYCNECVNTDMCIHFIQKCEKDSCTLVCNICYECNPDCVLCIKKHRNHYSTILWNKYIIKEYLLEPYVNYSYSTTVHKSQGQSIDNIIVAEYNVANCLLFNKEISEYQKMLIYPTCMYTAVTRAKNILVRLK